MLCILPHPIHHELKFKTSYIKLKTNGDRFELISVSQQLQSTSNLAPNLFLRASIAVILGCNSFTGDVSGLSVSKVF